MTRAQPPSARPIPQLFDLSDQVAIVTGAASGIGQGIAFRLSEAGATVLIADVDLPAAQATAEQITARGGRVRALRADASSVVDAGRVVQEALQTFGRLDILVNNAGIFPVTPALQISEQQWDHVLDVNLKGAFFYSQAAAQHMVAAGHGGRIVNIASIDALHPTGALAHYDASKGGMLMLTKALAKELGPHGITVNAIAPGGVQTPGAEAAMASMAPNGTTTASSTPVGAQVEGPPSSSAAARGLGAPPAYTPAAPSVTSNNENAAFTARIPLGRMGRPDDIATVALFLVSHAADYMTGALLVVDGGYLLS